MTQVHNGNVRVFAATFAAVLTLSACGADEPGEFVAPAAGSTDPTTSDAGVSVDADDGGSLETRGGCPVDKCDDAVLEELTGIPLPDFVEAYAYGTTERSDGLAVQQFFLRASVAEGGAFFDANLEAAGFEITFNYVDDVSYAVNFIDPQGRAGSITIGAREFHPVVMDVALQVA